MKDLPEKDSQEEPILRVMVAARMDLDLWGRLLFISRNANVSMSDAMRMAVRWGTNDEMRNPDVDSIVEHKRMELSQKRNNKKGTYRNVQP